MDAILRLDAALFRFFNGTLTSGVLDVVMPFITDKANYLGVVAVLLALVVFKGSKRDIWGIFLLIAVVLLSDLLSNTIKHLVGRTRPCIAIEGARLLVGCKKSFSFPSGHATNIFAAMVFLSTRYRRATPVFLVFAVAVAYSRVYVGVHYPLDIMGGAVLGTSVALVFAYGDRALTPTLAQYINRRRGFGRG